MNKVGDEVTVEFILNKKRGNQLVARVDGKVAFISKDNDEHIEPGSSWICRIEIIRDHSMVLKPLVIWKTPEQNNALAQQKLQELREKYAVKV